MPVHQLAYLTQSTEAVSLTLYVGDTLSEDLVENLGILKLLVDLGNDAVGQFSLLSGSQLTFVPHPRVKNRLDFGSQSRLLLQLVRLCLELSSFLRISQLESA